MRPDVVTAALLLVLMFVHHTEQREDDSTMAGLCKRYPQRSCSNGWYRLDEDRCMKFISTPKTFDKAEDQCYDLDGHLVSIHNEIQKIRVDCLAWRHSQKKNYFWIGAKSRREQFEYTDGSDFDYNNWHYKFSNYFLDKYSCAISNYQDWGVWGFTGCTRRLMFVCAKRM
ncbi:C-type isolectin Sp-CL4-like [Thunnus thynnus]|uniref:C-type isolectin Sp-CL4-like n=1 Tax=Thunnus thynnus TaxID=8237 RepID=UPI0035276A59